MMLFWSSVSSNQGSKFCEMQFEWTDEKSFSMKCCFPVLEHKKWKETLCLILNNFTFSMNYMHISCIQEQYSVFVHVNHFPSPCQRKFPIFLQENVCVRILYFLEITVNNCPSRWKPYWKASKISLPILCTIYILKKREIKMS